ncbi:hypothetical protein B9Z65_4300 [Elsinoe australis]|uniref:Uncharacterized protein n=1 Tax=Elsinoe australis TaxID=40998 RepID=A0A2P7Z2E4_9PEZI|nr:hypothetical protein B9Z65_4300 [Elsinoe australis]
MAGTPSMGDVLMLSHTAKSIGKAFGIKAPGVPQDFFEVERETDGLADSLKLLAYILEEDESILHATSQVQQGIFTILASAQMTLRDLSAFVERYSIYARIQSQAGTSAEKTWSKSTLTDWDKLPWTRDGGDMTTLRSLLMMHCSTVTMTTQALQSQSSDRLEKTILPLADKLEEIHDGNPGHLNRQLEELHFISMTIMHEQRTAALATRNGSFSPQMQDFDMPTPTPPTDVQQTEGLNLPSLQAVETLTSIPAPRSRTNRQGRSESLTQLHLARDAEGWKVRKRTSSQYSTISAEVRPRPQSQLVDSVQRSKRSKSADGPSGSRFPFFTGSDREARTVSRINTGGQSEHDLPQCPPTPRRLQKRRQPSTHRKSMPLPDSIDHAIHGRNDVGQTAARSSQMEDPDVTSNEPEDEPPQLPTPPRSRSGTGILSDSPPSEAAFTENLLKDTIKMFDERGRLVEALSAEPKGSQRQAASINTIISKACRILVLKRKSEPGIGGTWNTSIWIIASDFSVRLEQPLSTSLQPRSLAPHVAVKLPERVALTIPSKIQYHTPVWGCSTESSGTTLMAERVTYTFLSALAASRFQSVIFGQQLLDTFRIDRATLIRPGGGGRKFLYKVLGSEEQICSQQRIRLWEDDGDATPSTTAGGVLGLMHVQPTFGQGWIKWWVNSSRVSQIKNKSNGVVEIRGIDCLVSKPVPQPLRTVDNFTQCSLVSGVPLSAFDLAGSQISSERPSTSMSLRDDARSRHSRSPSLANMRSDVAAPPMPPTPQVNTYRNVSSLPRRSSRSRSRSGSCSHRDSSPNSVPADTDEPVPPVLRSDSSQTQVTTRSMSNTFASKQASAATPVSLALPPTPGKWDTPISPRSYKPRKSSEIPPVPSRTIAEPHHVAAPSPTPTTQPSHAKSHSRADSRIDTRADSRLAAREFDSMSFVSQKSKATTTVSTKSKARSWKSGRRKSKDHQRNEPKEEKKKVVHGMKIYFSSEDDKRRFLACVHRARERMLPLPDF